MLWRAVIVGLKINFLRGRATRRNAVKCTGYNNFWFVFRISVLFYENCFSVFFVMSFECKPLKCRSSHQILIKIGFINISTTRADFKDSHISRTWMLFRHFSSRLSVGERIYCAIKKFDSSQNIVATVAASCRHTSGG